MRAAEPPAHSFLQIQGRISTVRKMAKDVPKQPAEAQAAHKPKDFVQLAQERAALGQQSFYATLKPASPVLSVTPSTSAVPPAPTKMDTSSAPEPQGVESLQKAIVTSVMQALEGQVKAMIDQIRIGLFEQYNKDQENMQQQIEQLTLDTVQRKTARTQE